MVAAAEEEEEAAEVHDLFHAVARNVAYPECIVRASVRPLFAFSARGRNPR